MRLVARAAASASTSASADKVTPPLMSFFMAFGKCSLLLGRTAETAGGGPHVVVCHLTAEMEALSGR